MSINEKIEKLVAMNEAMLEIAELKEMINTVKDLEKRARKIADNALFVENNKAKYEEASDAARQCAEKRMRLEMKLDTKTKLAKIMAM